MLQAWFHPDDPASRSGVEGDFERGPLRLPVSIRLRPGSLSEIPASSIALSEKVNCTSRSLRSPMLTPWSSYICMSRNMLFSEAWPDSVSMRAMDVFDSPDFSAAASWDQPRPVLAARSATAARTSITSVSYPIMHAPLSIRLRICGLIVLHPANSIKNRHAQQKTEFVAATPHGAGGQNYCRRMLLTRP